jgi:isocitrate lyase
MTYQSTITEARQPIGQNGHWEGIEAESVARMRLQNRFRTGLDIARYTAKIMRRDMAAYDADPANYTQSLGCWHGFIGQQKLISIKKHFGSTKGRYLYLSGWMVAALRSEFGPLPDQSMHEKTSVPALIEELYTFLRQADARELGGLFRDLDAAKAAGDAVEPTVCCTRSTSSRPTSCRSSPTSTPVSAMPRRPICWPRSSSRRAPAASRSKTRSRTKSSAATRTAR